MAHSIFHFAAGQTIGTCVLVPLIFARLLSRKRAARLMLRGLAGTYLLACLAILPNVLQHAGLIRPLPQSWWMNIFVLHTLIDGTVNGGMLIGEILAVWCFAVQYALVLIAICRAGHVRRR